MSNGKLLPPGFRFHPTDEELIVHYLRRRAASLPCPASIIAEVDIYKFDPWDLPAKALFGDREWYFFSPRERKYPNGVRPNRTAASGYWKATGTDKTIFAASSARATTKETIGLKKALVFYEGKPPRGKKSNWIMHEYRLINPQKKNSSIFGGHHRPSLKLSMRLDDWVLYRIYRKSSHFSLASPMEQYLKQHEAYWIAAGDATATQLERITAPPAPTSELPPRSAAGDSEYCSSPAVLHRQAAGSYSVVGEDDQRRRQAGGSVVACAELGGGEWPEVDAGDQSLLVGNIARRYLLTQQVMLNSRPSWF